MLAFLFCTNYICPFSAVSYQKIFSNPFSTASFQYRNKSYPVISVHLWFPSTGNYEDISTFVTFFHWAFSAGTGALCNRRLYGRKERCLRCGNHKSGSGISTKTTYLPSNFRRRHSSHTGGGACRVQQCNPKHFRRTDT